MSQRANDLLRHSENALREAQRLGQIGSWEEWDVATCGARALRKSTRARADVKGEAKQAVKSGEGKGEWECPKPGKDAKSRAEVKAEAKQAVKKGEVGKGEADIKK